MSKTMRRLTAVLLTGVAVTALAACGSGGEGPNPNPTVVPGVTPGGKLTIGIPFDEPGIGVQDGTSYKGFDVDTATYVAKALGVPPQNITWVKANGADREQLLAGGQADLIFSTDSITDARKPD